MSRLVGAASRAVTTVLITGDAGFVGTYLRDAYFDAARHVAGYDLRNLQDLRNYEDIRAAIDDVQPDIVHHLAAQAYVPETTTDPRRGVDTNIVGTLNLLEAIRHTGCRARVHIAGTSEEYGYETQDGPLTERSAPQPTTLYGASKLAATQLALAYGRTFGIPVVVTRAFNHTGPRQPARYAIPSFARRIALIEADQMRTLAHGNLDAVRNYTDVRDIVRAYQQAPHLDAGIYNICSPNTLPIGDVLTMLADLATVAIPLEPDPDLYRPGLHPGSKTFPTPVCDKFHTATGWEPLIPLQQTLRDVLDYWRSHL